MSTQPFMIRPRFSDWLPSELGHLDGDRTVRRSVRDWIVDVNLFLLFTGLGMLIWVNQAQYTRGGMLSAIALTDLAFGSLCLLLIWWRRRWPTWIALAMVPIAIFSALAVLPALLMVYTVAVRRPLRTLVIVTALHGLAGAAYAFVRRDPYYGLFVSLSSGVLALAVVVAWALFARARYQLVLSLQDRAERAEAERSLLLQQARLAERTRIAREMHDVLGHRISLISLHAGALEFRADKAGPEVAESAAVIRASAHQALQELREVIGVLRSDVAPESPVRPQPTPADIPALVEESRQAGMKVDLRCELPESGPGAPTLIGRTAYRIVQEGLTNARKHAPGTAVKISLSGGPGEGLTVTVLNRAPLQPPSLLPETGQGLIGLNERVDLVDGHLEQGRTATGDFRLTARLPWPVPEDPTQDAPGLCDDHTPARTTQAPGPAMTG